jgi:iron donor protein CyaY
MQRILRPLAAGRRDRHRHQRTGGLLELSFPNGSKIIVNTQPPLHEVWLAARGGGFHYRWVDGLARHARRQRILRGAVHTPACRAGQALASSRWLRPSRSALEQGRGCCCARPSAWPGCGHLVFQAHAADAGAVGNSSYIQSGRLCTTPSGGLRLLHRHALEGVLHVLDPHRQRRPPPVSRSPSLRGCRSRSRPRPPARAGSRRTRRPSNRWWCRSCRTGRAA